jgi:glycyl-tRNA synthetase alpha chain
VTLQELVFQLERFWSERGCLIHQPWDAEVGAGTMHPETFFRVLGPEPWRSPTCSPRGGRPTAATARTRTASTSTSSSR